MSQGGKPDSSFATRGIAQTMFNDWNTIQGIVQTPSGKLIVAGSCGDKAVPSNARVLMMIYSADGVQESSLVTNFVTTREAQASDIVLQSDGKFLIVGYTQNPSDNNGQIVVARYTP
jgi:hypothetical protein